jgi:hypothetical protein
VRKSVSCKIQLNQRRVLVECFEHDRFDLLTEEVVCEFYARDLSVDL